MNITTTSPCLPSRESILSCFVTVLSEYDETRMLMFVVEITRQLYVKSFTFCDVLEQDQAERIIPSQIKKSRSQYKFCYVAVSMARSASAYRYMFR